MTLYLILGLLGDSSEYVADEQILMSILGITKVSIIGTRPTWKPNTDDSLAGDGRQLSIY
jgi:hypothetical protein